MTQSKITAADSAIPEGSPQSCSLWRRLLIMAYDTVAVIVLMMLTTVLAMLAGFRELNVIQDPGYALALLVTWFLYLGWCWRRGGVTLGMRAWRVRIERLHGGLPGWGHCALRFPASLLAAAPLGLGFWWSLFDRDRLCWHDRLSKTRLVRHTDSQRTSQTGH